MTTREVRDPAPPPPPPSSSSPTSRRARGRRRGRALLVVAVVLVVLGVAAAVALPGLDRRARLGAATAVAAQLQRELGLAEPPAVTLTGPRFLLQALRGRYTGATVAVGAITRDGASAQDVLVRLRDVEVPAGVLLGRGGTVTVGSGTARALVPWSEVEARAAASAGRPVDLAAAGDDVRATTRATVLRREVELAVTATPELTGDRLRLRPVAVALAGRELTVAQVRSGLGRAGLEQAGGLLDGIEVDLGGALALPPEVGLRRLAVVEAGLVVHADVATLTVPVPAR